MSEVLEVNEELLSRSREILMKYIPILTEELKLEEYPVCYLMHDVDLPGYGKFLHPQSWLNNYDEPFTIQIFYQEIYNDSNNGEYLRNLIWTLAHEFRHVHQYISLGSSSYKRIMDQNGEVGSEDYHDNLLEIDSEGFAEYFVSKHEI